MCFISLERHKKRAGNVGYVKLEDRRINITRFMAKKGIVMAVASTELEIYWKFERGGGG